MLISYNWLKELVDFSYSPEELGRILTDQGMTVDGMERVGFPYEKVVVGEIVEVEKHPDAEKLTVLKVNAGTDDLLQIVCGAPGVAPGQKVPVALEGAVLGDFKIKKTKLRGVDSCGMCCAADELAISNTHDTLLNLDESLEVGTPFENILKGEDYIYDLDITGNRPDLLNHVGIAREIAAHLAFESGSSSPYEPPEISYKTSDENVEDKFSVRIDDEKLCPRYTARLVENVSIKPSPLWMQARLFRLGMRPINNIVDITNYVLLEYGHPLHAFDADKIAGNEIIIRRANKDEKIISLDDVERELDSEMLLISDKEKGIALAGVMGGANSEVHENTKNILIESAYFDGPNIRRTVKLLGLESESSYRFERNVRGAAAAASARTAELIVKYANGIALKGIIDNQKSNNPPLKGEPEGWGMLTVDYNRCISLLGLDIPKEKGINALSVLGFAAEESGDKINITIPEHRVDISEWPDIAEELARIVGYNSIPSDINVKFRSEKQQSKIFQCRNSIRNVFSGIGLYEAYNPSLVSKELLLSAGYPETAKECNTVQLANASTHEQSVMRTVLSPGLLRNLQHNIAHGAKSLKVFEIGKVYSPENDGEGFVEKEKLGMLLWGDKSDVGWWQDNGEFEFSDGKGLLELLFGKLNFPAPVFEEHKIDGCHPGRTALIRARNKKELGWIAELNPGMLRALDIEGRVVAAEIDVEILSKMSSKSVKFKQLPKFPASTRDIAFVISEKYSNDEVCETVDKLKINFLESVSLFDLYHGEQIPEGMKSMAYHFVYRAPDRTLTDKEVDKFHEKIVKELTDKLKAEIRS